MKVLFYSTRSFERKYLEASAIGGLKSVYTQDVLSLETSAMAKGFDAVSLFTGDDASAPVLASLYHQGVRFIALRSAGYDNVDLKKARELGISVANVPAYSPSAIAEHAVALVLALNRKIIRANEQVHRHDFSTDNLVGFDLHGKSVGIIGTGRIGSVFARIMHGFGCRLLACDITENTRLKNECHVEYTDLVSLCRNSSIISVHTPLTLSTKHLINNKLIGLMQKGVMLINTSRGGCVDTKAVLDGLDDGRIGYFGADVYEYENGIFFHDHSGNKLTDPLLKNLLAKPNVLITPHQGFATNEALGNIASVTMDNLSNWNMGRRVVNEIAAG